FRGVCTVVTKLFNILRPNIAIFGEKDFQQLAIVRRMTRDLNFGIEIVSVPIIREADGLAYSSRNAYLKVEERKQASVLHRLLVAARESGEKNTRKVIELVRHAISQASLARIDYVEIVNATTLQPTETVGLDSVMTLAVYFGQTRLIDNIRLR